MSPTVGRIVHYYLPESPGAMALGGAARTAPIAAIVTRTNGAMVDLMGFHPDDGPLQYLNRMQSDTPTPGFWTWPPRD